jgi:N-acylneuraminate cytidylyltransferase/CMP-N,N'-diacetyllegionaminic acid synthase
VKVLAIIPARGGSKGIPKKNIIPLMGKPLIQYTITAAQESTIIDKIFLSSDNTEIIDVAKQLNLDCNYVRPDHLADDQANTVDVVLDALTWLEETESYVPDTILLLQPTSPLRSSEDIDNAIKLFIKNGKDTLISVHEMAEHPYECVKDIDTDDWSYLSEQPTNATRRQDYKKKFYYINGAIYLTSVDFFKKEKKFIEKNCTSFYVMPYERGIDIDEYHHLDIANALLTRTLTQ